jgi:single-stranded-DNA-specific exonuclease
MSIYALPNPLIKQRILKKEVYDEAIIAGYTPLQSSIIANRELPEGTDLIQFKYPDINKIANIGLLADISKGGERIADAIVNDECMALVCDFDVDGTSSAAVLYKSLTEFFGAKKENVRVIISNRMLEGYGMSNKVLERIYSLEKVPTLLITADQGSADGERITKYLSDMTEMGYKADVVVSDHHEIPKTGGPKDAYAFINPQRPDSAYPDRTICGCTVALFLMAATKAKLKSKYQKDIEFDMKQLLAYSTAATIADCVSMASQVNRAIVTRGLQEINDGKIPAWRIMKELVSAGDIVKSGNIGFGLGPRINACSRTGGDGLNAVKYYLSKTDEQAKHYFDLLTVDNETRKNIELELVETSTYQAMEYVAEGFLSLVIFNKFGHHGIHGIAASRLVEKFGRPVIMLSPKETIKELISEDEVKRLIKQDLIPEKENRIIDLESNKYITYDESAERNYYLNTITLVSGSARSIDGLGEDNKDYLDILDCLNDAHAKYNLFLGHGGHHMAAGMSLKYENITVLREGIEEAVRERVNPAEIHPKVLTDGYLPVNRKIDMSLFREIEELEPYGRQFDYPAFTVDALVKAIKIVGTKKDTAQFVITVNGQDIKGIWFKYTSHPMFEVLHENGIYRMIIEIGVNKWQGRESIQVMIRHAEEIEED